MPLEHPSCSVHNESPGDDAVGVHSCKRARAPSEHRHSPVSPPLDDGQDNSCQFSGNTCKTIPVAQPVAAQESPNTSCPSKEPFILEICAGTARVTSCLQALGLTSSFGVDHKRLKNAGRVLVADLTTPEGQNLCWEWIHFSVHHHVELAAVQGVFQSRCPMDVLLLDPNHCAQMLSQMGCHP